LTVHYQGRDPQDCQTVLESVLDSYGRFLGETERGINDQTIELMTRAKEELHEQLTQKEAAYLTFRKEAPLQWNSDSKQAQTVHTARLAQLEHERVQLQRQRTEIETHIQTVEEAMDQGADKRALLLLIARMDDAANGGRARSLDLETQLLTLQAQEQLLLRDFGPDHPLVKAVEEKITAWRSYLDNGGTISGKAGQPDMTSEDFLPIYLDSRKREVAEMDRLEEELSDAYLQEQKAAQESMVYVLQDRNYQNDLDRTQRLFEQALQSLQTLTLLRDHGGYSMQVIWPPGPGGQVKPQVPLSLAIASLIGLFLGFGISYLRYITDQQYHDPHQIQSELGVPVLAHIPHLSRHRLVPGRKHNGQLTQPTTRLFMNSRPDSAEAEACRAIQTALWLHHRRDGQKVIQITSPRVGDGKTTLAANLSAALALPDQRILLIDANLRRPAIHELLGINNQVGLATLMAAGSDFESIESQLARSGDLWIMPSGPVHSNPSEWLTSSAFERVMESIRERFDVVLVDGPPILGVADACAIAHHVDSVLLVMRLNKNSRLEAAQAVETLERAGAKIAGTVVNAVARNSAYDTQLVTNSVRNGKPLTDQAPREQPSFHRKP